MSYYAMTDIIINNNETATINDYNINFRKSQLINYVCDHYNVGVSDITGLSRIGRVRDARNLIMYCLHKVLKITCIETGRIVNRNHATVLNGSRRVMNYIETDKEYNQFVNELINK
jgi:chromosomal replication initiation ATPase DnaA